MVRVLRRIILSQTKVFLELFLCFYMVLFEFIREFFESLKVFNGDSHFFDFLDVRIMRKILGCWGGKINLAKHEVAFRQSYDHVFGTKCIIQLVLQSFNFDFGIGKFDKTFFVRCF